MKTPETVTFCEECDKAHTDVSSQGMIWLAPASRVQRLGTNPIDLSGQYCDVGCLTMRLGKVLKEL